MTLRPAQVKDLLIENLRQAIVAGRLPPGQRLTELRLAEGLGVSRTPVREALMALHHLGLVTQHHSGRGFEVRGYSLDEARDLIYVRSVLESAAAERIARNPSPAAIDRLRQLVAEEREQLERGEYATLKAGGHVFHVTLVKSSGSDELLFLFTNVLDKLRAIFTSGGPAYDNRWRSHEGHRDIVEAIAAGEPELARRLVREHCHMAWETLTQDPVRLAAQQRPLQSVLEELRGEVGDAAPGMEA